MVTYFVGSSIEVFESFQDSLNTDNVTIEIRRPSDNFLWDFTNHLFTPTPTLSPGPMLFVSNISWSTSFIPNTVDYYVATIKNVTSNVTKVEVFRVDPVPISPAVPLPVVLPPSTTFNSIQVFQDFQDSLNTDTVTVEIRRPSDNFLWDFTNNVFTATPALSPGNMIFVSGITWQTGFTPDTLDYYIATIKDVRLDVTKVQVFQSTPVSLTPPPVIVPITQVDTAPFNSIEVNWVTPAEILTAGPTIWDRIHIYRSGSENTGYILISKVDFSTQTPVSFTPNPINTVNSIGHGFVNGDLVAFGVTNGGQLPSTLSFNVIYFVINATANTFQVSVSPTGAPIAFLTAGLGPQYSLRGTFLSDIPSQSASIWQTIFRDITAQQVQSDFYYYLIRYFSTTANRESKFYLTFKTPTPREQRLMQSVKLWVTPWIANCMTDDDIRGGISLALNAINIYPPLTAFNMSNFPINLEPLLVPGSAIFTLMFKYLGVAFTDMSYTDNGLTLTVDRGAKVKTAIDTTLGYYNQLIGLAKLEYSFGGLSVGTIQLPISIGGNLNRGLLNIFDIFTTLGR